MLLEKTSQALRALGERLFALVEKLSGESPVLSSDWYQAKVVGGPALWFRFVGPSARTYPKNSILLVTKWSDDLASIDGVTQGNNFHGPASADLSACPDHPQEIDKAEEFVRHAFGSRGTSLPAPKKA